MVLRLLNGADAILIINIADELYVEALDMSVIVEVHTVEEAKRPIEVSY